MHVHQVRRPGRQVVQDMRRVHHGRVPRRRLARQELEEPAPAQQVEVDRDLVQEQNPPGAQQAHGELHAPPLPVADRVHAPARVNVQEGDELVAPRGEGVAANGGEQRGDVDVGAHDGVEDPFGAEVRDAFEARGEGVDAGDKDGAAGAEALAGEQAEEGGLAGAVGFAFYVIL